MSMFFRGGRGGRGRLEAFAGVKGWEEMRWREGMERRMCWPGRQWKGMCGMVRMVVDGSAKEVGGVVMRIG